MEEGEVVVGFAVAAGGDAAHCFQPGVGALDRPAVPGLRVACFEVSFLAAPDLACGLADGDRLALAARLADPRLDLALKQRLFERARGVAAISPELARLDPLLEQPVDKRDQVPLLVLVAGSEPDRERRALGVYGEVVAAAGPAAERARDRFAPFFASTREASTITRDQSSLSAARNSSCSNRIAAVSRPRRCHSSSRRRQVSPEGRPSSR